MRKITVVKQFKFEAAHRLPDYNGPCSRLHGHTYKLEVGFNNRIDTQTGMVIDFSKIKEMIKTHIVDVLDHTYMNYCTDVPDFPYLLPTAENMVEWMVNLLSDNVQFPAELVFVRLWETDTSYAEWRL